MSIQSISDRISRLDSGRIKRIDCVVSTKARRPYYFVHFERHMSEALWDMLSYGAKTIETDDGPIRISLNQSNGLNPNTTDQITQYMTTNDGSYWRDFKHNVVHKMNANGWVVTEENPFVISEMEVVGHKRKHE
jgi:hypothetical protein